jgi:hypothetical protein
VLHFYNAPAVVTDDDPRGALAIIKKKFRPGDLVVSSRSAACGWAEQVAAAVQAAEQAAE